MAKPKNFQLHQTGFRFCAMMPKTTYGRYSGTSYLKHANTPRAHHSVKWVPFLSDVSEALIAAQSEVTANPKMAEDPQFREMIADGATILRVSYEVSE